MDQGKKVKKTYSPEQKANIVHQIETDIKSGLKAIDAVEKQSVTYSMFSKWRKQLAVGIKSSLRNGKAPADKEKKRPEFFRTLFHAYSWLIN